MTYVGSSDEGFILTIAVPSFNRPGQLKRLLDSIDCDPTGIEVLVSEDHAPRRDECRHVVRDFASNSPYEVRYSENDTNLGFDGNIRQLVGLARGRWIMFIGDDDAFIPNQIEEFRTFLGTLEDEKYVLRSYRVTHESGRTEEFQYLPDSRRIAPGEKSVAWLFKRSVTISGFTIDRQAALHYSTEALDGTLLYQVYLMAMVCIDSPSRYCRMPVAEITQTYRGDAHMFGSSLAESSRFTPGSVTTDNSVNFTKAYFEVTGYLDGMLGTELTGRVLLELSKYSYPFLSIQRKRGLRAFLQYANRLENEVGLGVSPYFHLYKWVLALFGERACDYFIGRVKSIVGHAPNF